MEALPGRLRPEKARRICGLGGRHILPGRGTLSKRVPGRPSNTDPSPSLPCLLKIPKAFATHQNHKTVIMLKAVEKNLLERLLPKKITNASMFC